MKISPLLFQAGLWLACIALLFCAHFSPPSSTPPTEANKISKRDRMDLAMKQEVEMTRDPALGYVPRERLLQTQAYTKRLQQANSRAALLGVQWTEMGPKNVGGRTRAILVDPNDLTQKSVFAAGVAGGLWKTTDITVSAPNWQVVDDFFSNLAITCIAVSPANPQIMYFGTGEGYYNLDAVRGQGLWKSTDGGQSWIHLSSTDYSNFNYCQRLAVTPSGAVLVATMSGLYRSADGGNSWVKVLGGNGVSNTLYDIEIAANGDVYVAPFGSVHRSTDDGLTYSALAALPITAERIELACAPSNANYIYLLAEAGNQASGILLSTNQGASWQLRNEPSDADPGIPTADFCRSQAWYNLAIAVDPNDENVLMVGGIDLFKSDDGGLNWTQISHWYGGFGFQDVHADQHYILYEPGNSAVAYFGNDGGIYRTANANTNSPTISSKENNYRTAQFYACAMHPDLGSYYFLAGAQDNGSHRFTDNALNNTTEVTGGDGAFCHIDQTQPLFQFTSYVYNNFRRSTNGGNSFVSISGGNTGRFINPSDYDNDAHLMYSAHNSGSYLRWDNPQSGNSFTAINGGFGGRVSTIICDPHTSNRVYFGIDNGRVYRVDNAHSASPVITQINNLSGMPLAYISCIAIADGNADHLLVTYANWGVNSVWETTNGGATWQSVEGNLPDMPVRWAIFNPHNEDQALLATEVGVWSTDDLSAYTTQWGPSNNGLANCRVDMLQTRASDHLVIAATHGRGLFASDVFMGASAAFDADRRVTYIGKTVKFINQSTQASSWYWDFGDGQYSRQESPSHTYSTAGKYQVSLTINNGADVLVKNGFIHIVPNKGGDYSLQAGGDLESNPLDFATENLSGTAWELGESSYPGKDGTASGNNAFVTSISSPYLDNSESYLYTPEFDLSQSGNYLLRFKGRFFTETGYDGFRVEYTTDQGDSWRNLGTVAPAWYNFSNFNWASSFPYSEPFFTGNFGSAFANFFYDLSTLVNISHVGFRFAFKSDNSVAAAGVAIDDIELDGMAFPVELIDFTGDWRGQIAALEWRTASEQQNDGFQLQRSVDGSFFTDVAFVESKGNTSAGHSYHYDDLSPGTQLVTYYRLKQYDLDGSFTFLPTIQLSRTELPSQVELYPNPIRNAVFLQTSREGSLLIRNLLGQVMLEQHIRPGENRLDLSGLDAGIYLLTIMEGDELIFGRKITKI